MPEYTRTQRNILHVLSDGRRHLVADLIEVLQDKEMDPKSARKTLGVHITYLRKKINPIGEDIVCEYHSKRLHYRHVRLISSA